MRTGWIRLMVIVVQDGGSGLIKSTEACSFIKSHSADDNDDNDLKLFHLILLLQFSTSSFHGRRIIHYNMTEWWQYRGGLYIYIYMCVCVCVKIKCGSNKE